MSIGQLTVDSCSLHGADLGRGEKVYLCGTYGSNGNSGKTAGTALQTLAAAESTCVAARNDTVLVSPENVLVPTEIAWDKDNTHIFGLGGPNTRGGDFGAYFYSIATDLAQLINITGKRCQISRITIANHGNNAACVAALLINAEGTWLRDVNIVGNINTAQAQNGDCTSLIIHDDGSLLLAENCVIGNNVNTGIRNQTDTGQLLFSSAVSGPSNGKFVGCTFLSRAETATVSMVYFKAASSIDRLWIWDDCEFHNFSPNWATELVEVFDKGALTTTATVMLKNCCHHGFGEWTSDNTGKWLVTNMAAAASAAPGRCVEATT